jgi:hypothetical protein
MATSPADANAAAAEYTWKVCALLGRLSASHSALFLKDDFFFLHPTPFLLRRRGFDMDFFLDG